MKRRNGGGVNSLPCDGSARFLADTIDMELFARLTTVGGGVIAPLPD